MTNFETKLTHAKYEGTIQFLIACLIGIGILLVGYSFVYWFIGG